MGTETISESPEQRKAVVEPDEAGTRLDRFLAARFGELSRSRLKALILDGRVALDGGPVRDPAVKLRAGSRIVLEVPAPVAAVPEAQAIALEVAFEDDDLIVIDKPAGLVVHPAPGTPERTLVNALIAHCGASLSGIGGVRRPGIVHRLDKDTSGLLVAAKNDRAHAGLAAQFKARTIRRLYRAAVWGTPVPPAGRIEGNIGRSATNRKKMAVVEAPRGKPAVTDYTTLRRFGAHASLLECRLATGRTHQIRVHLEARGHPLIGDTAYGRGRRRTAKTGGNPPISRQALHAAVLGFSHPLTGTWLEFASEMPSDFRELVAWLERLS